MSALSIMVIISVAFLAGAMLLGLRLIVKGPDAGSRAVVGDVAFFSAVGIVILIGMFTGSAVVLDVALLAGLVGMLATIALSRIITRGRR